MVYVRRRNEKKKKWIVGTPRFHLTFRGKTMPLVYEVDNIQSKLGRETCQVAGNFQRPQRGF